MPSEWRRTEVVAPRRHGDGVDPYIRNANLEPVCTSGRFAPSGIRAYFSGFGPRLGWILRFASANAGFSP